MSRYLQLSSCPLVFMRVGGRLNDWISVDGSLLDELTVWKDLPDLRSALELRALLLHLLACALLKDLLLLGQVGVDEPDRCLPVVEVLQYEGDFFGCGQLHEGLQHRPTKEYMKLHNGREGTE